jgi:hypothetical protein
MADGMQVLVTFTFAPRWAEAAGRPADAPPGTWRPNPRDLEDYGVALGRRYSGHFPDPADPLRMLPRVYAFQPWNEPNLSTYLNPQWSGGRTAAPALYRRMLNAFYAGLKSVDPGALVATAGTAPFGDPEPGGQRIMPARFWRDALCVPRAGSGVPGSGFPGLGFNGAGCSEPAHFDVLAHHPYSVGPPHTKALNADDVSIPDIGKLTAILRAAERSGGALPHERHRVWVTEVSYDSKPPDPQAVPIAQHARWLEESLQLLWSQGVSTVFWNQVGDQPPIPDYASTDQSGVYFIDGRPKQALIAYRFPFVAWRARRSLVDVWGRAPATGRLVIERRVGRTWSSARTLSVRAGSVFVTAVAGRGATDLRGQIGATVSLDWRVS